jgi:hypothetical protein
VNSPNERLKTVQLLCTCKFKARQQKIIRRIGAYGIIPANKEQIVRIRQI